jgi:hypothetical protein
MGAWNNKGVVAVVTTPDKNNVARLQKTSDHNFLTYRDNDQEYCYMFRVEHRSNDLIIFTDELDQDVTNLLTPYLGPMQNFHGSSLTPGDFHRKKIKVFRDGKISLMRTFNEDDPIIF